MPADLHTHSRASDGVDRPAGVMRAAAAAGLTVVALTDHDTTDGWDEAAQAARDLGLLLVPGTEISCLAGGISVHLLSYLHDPTEPQLREVLRVTRADRVGRARAIVQRLAAVVDLRWEDVAGLVAPGTTVGRPHIADALVARGVVATRDEAFAALLHRDSPYYVPHAAPQVEDAVRLVRRAGGVPVLAHPLADRRGRAVSEEMIASFVGAGLLGIEADHPDHTGEQRERVRLLAARYGLFWTGGSDYHGVARSYRIGEWIAPEPALEEILATGRGTGAVS